MVLLEQPSAQTPLVTGERSIATVQGKESEGHLLAFCEVCLLYKRDAASSLRYVGIISNFQDLFVGTMMGTVAKSEVAHLIQR